RVELRTRVEAHLEEWSFEEADNLYNASCVDWWPSADFMTLRTQAMHTKCFVEMYSHVSLAGLDAHYRGVCDSRLPANDYAHLKLPKLRMRLARLGMPLDEEQLLACARPEQHRLIRARAGSGKTRTLAALAALSIHDEALDP